MKKAVYFVFLSTALFAVSCSGGGEPGGGGPLPPYDPMPANGATNVSIKPTFSWKARHTNPSAQMYFHLYLSTQNPPTTLLKAGITSANYTYDKPTLLTINTTYYWKILALDEDGKTAESLVWSFTTSPSPDITPPDTRITAKQPDRAKLNTNSIWVWFDSTEPNSTFQCRIDDGNWIDSCTSGQEFDISSLTDGLHQFFVRAFDAAGNADPTAARWEFELDRTPTGNPQNLNLKSGDEMVQLTWDAPGDSDLSGFRIYASTQHGFDYKNCGCMRAEVGRTQTSALVENLQNGQVYYFRVTALDEAGNESGSTFEEFAQPDEASIRVSQYPKAGLDVAFDGERYLVVWSEKKGENYDIYGQFIHPAGWMEGGDFPIYQSAGEQYNPRLVYDSVNGYYVVVWEDERNNQTDIYAAIVEKNGSVSPSGGIRITTDASFQSFPDVAVNTLGALVVWMDFRAVPAMIRGARLIGGALVPEDRDGFEISISAGRPRIAGGPALFLVAWTKWNSEPNYELDIEGARVSWTGTLDIQPFSIFSAEEEQNRPVVTVENPEDANTPFFVFWEETDTGGVRAVRVLQTGEVEPVQEILVGAPREQTFLDARSVQDSQILLTWAEHSGNIALIQFQKFLSISGILTAAIPPTFLSRHNQFDQTTPQVSFDGNRLFIVWLDGRDAVSSNPPDLDIFGHLVS